MWKSSKTKKEYNQAYYLAHRDKDMARSRARYIVHKDEIKVFRQTPEFKARQRVRNRKSYLAHQDERKESSRLYRIAHRDEIKIKKSVAGKIYRLSHKDELRAKKVAYERRPGVKEMHASSSRKSHLKLKYSMTLADVDMLLAKQDGKCAICKSDKFNGPGPCIDHDHITGKIRGILCTNCNMAIGYAHNDALVLRLMADYLGGTNEKG
jgi:hypothetical protein